MNSAYLVCPAAVDDHEGERCPSCLQTHGFELLVYCETCDDRVCTFCVALVTERHVCPRCMEPAGDGEAS